MVGADFAEEGILICIPKDKLAQSRETEKNVVFLVDKEHTFIEKRIS